MAWLDKAKEKIFECSVEKNNLTKALDEWEYRGNTYDTEGNFEVCQLCGHSDLRYQFEIINRLNQDGLLVGSECIKKFSHISVFDEQGQKLDVEGAKKKIDKDKRGLIQDAEIRSVLSSLIQLSWKKDEKFEFEKSIERFNERNAFSPNELALILWRLEENKVPFVKKHFKVSFRRQREREQLVAMPDWKLKKMLDCFSPAQMKTVEKIRKNGQ